ncbi:unnamed protein product [Cochlearia groenlandica]
MTRVSNLTLLFRDKLKTCNENSNKDSDVIETKVTKQPEEISSSTNNDKDNLTKWVKYWPSFQMPLHYPSFTKEQYEVMSEEELDRLLKLYGLPTDFEDLSRKKEFAIGAFLWEKEQNSFTDKHEPVNIDSCVDDLGESSLMGLIKVVKDLVYYIFGVK